jgi:3-oxoacyl-[acyl-carrier protein] reductase
MEIGTGKPVSRRSALGGMGAAMALPLVSSASPVSSARVEGKVAIVTGSGRNLGRAGVLELARRGADVVVNARTNRQEAEAVAREAESLGVRALALLADVGNEEQVNRMVDEVLTQFGRVDILINNAGSGRLRTTLRDISTAEWRQVLAVNLDGPFFCARACVPSMISNGGGRIINLSGMNSFSGAHWPHVCASKMGALGLTRALAVELAPHNILVNYVVPGGWDESATSLEDMAPESRGLERIPLRNLSTTMGH